MSAARNKAVGGRIGEYIIPIDPITGAELGASGGGGGGASTIADGADVNQGTTTDAKVTGDSAGTIAAKLRGANTVLGTPSDTSASVTVLGRLINLLSRHPSAIGQRTAADSLSVTLASDIGTIATGGNFHEVVAEWTRPADTTAYAVTDVIGTSPAAVLTFANAARAVAGSGYITKVRLTKAKTSVGSSQMKVWFYSTAPTAVADNAQWPRLYANRNNFVGTLDLGSHVTGGTGSDCAEAADATIRIPYECAGGSSSIYAVVTALAGYTPDASEQFTLTLGFDRN